MSCVAAPLDTPRATVLGRTGCRRVVSGTIIQRAAASERPDAPRGLETFWRREDAGARQVLVVERLVAGRQGFENGADLFSKLVMARDFWV